MNDTTLGLQEYSTLTVLRVAVKMLTRVNVRPDSFRNTLLRRLSVSACDVLSEIVTEVESYDPALVNRESKAEEQLDTLGSRAPDTLPDVRRNAENDRRRAMSLHRTVEPEREDAPLPADLAKALKSVFAGKREKRPYHRKRVLSPEHRAKLVARGTQEHICPHCGATGRGPVMFRVHFDRCRKRVAQFEVADVPS